MSTFDIRIKKSGLKVSHSKVPSSEILISPVIVSLGSTKKADLILEMLGLGDLCGCCFKNPTCESNVTIKFKVQRRLSYRLATIMFRGT